MADPDIPGTDLPLSREMQVHLDQFKTATIRHPILDRVEKEVMYAIWEPAGFVYLLIYGPSGVGKSTLMRHVEKQLRKALANQDHGGRSGPFLLLLETRPPDGELFHRSDYYRTALRLLGRTSFEGRKSARYQDDPELRYTLEETLRTQGVRTVALDEAQHLMKVANAATPLEQLDWIKSMTNVTGVLHILVGTYSLLHFSNLNEQTARRGLEIHFPRYHIHLEEEAQAFRNALLTLLKLVPLAVDSDDLIQHWPYFYERSIGCVGVLKEWLVRATAFAMREGSSSLQLSHIEKRALSDAKCERMIADVRDGENELRYTEGHRSRLRQLLGMSDGTQQAGRTVTDMDQGHVRDISTLSPSPSKTASVRVGERAPVRDRVGTTDEPERTAKCPGSGMIDLEVRTLTQSSTSYVECPACGSVRTVQLKGDTVMLRWHYRLQQHEMSRDGSNVGRHGRCTKSNTLCFVHLFGDGWTMTSRKQKPLFGDD